MSRYVLSAFTSVIAGYLLVAAPAPQGPTAQALVAGLSDPSEKVRSESAAALRNRVDALPWLRRAARSGDKDTARRASDLLAPHEPKRQEAVAKVIDACIRDGRIDLFMEWHHYWQPENKHDLWSVGPRAANAGLIEYAKARSPAETKRLEESLSPVYKKDLFFDGSDAALTAKGTGNWHIRADRWSRWVTFATFASVAGPTHMGVGVEARRGKYFFLGSLQTIAIQYAFIACDGEIENGANLNGVAFGARTLGSVVVCRGNYSVNDVFTSVILVDGDIDLSNSTRIQNCLIRASGEVRLPKDVMYQPVNCTIEAHAKNATAPYKFFEFADVGLSLADDEEGLVVTAVKADTPFGDCGIAKGDLIRAIDDVPAGHSEEFRKKVRRALVRQGDCLITVVRGAKTHDLLVFFPLPK